MKIGIITFNSAHNYGAVLQAFALQEKLVEEGHEVHVINYRIPGVDNLYQLYKKDKSSFALKRKWLDFWHYFKVRRQDGAKVRQYNKFEDFINHKLHTTEPFYSYSQLKNSGLEFDALIAGSDQIWNGGLTKGINLAYFLEFGKPETKRISYAASIGKDHIEPTERILFSKYLRNFDFLSVREESAKTEIQGLIKRQVEVVSDPTILLDRSRYDAIKVDPDFKGEYIYVHNVHLVRVDEALNGLAERLSKKTGLPIIQNRADYDLKNEAGKFTDGGPLEFLGWIANARYVVTNSFHSTVFSILYERTFVTVPHFKNPARMQHLLGSLGISKNLIENKERLPKNLETLQIDYTEVKKQLAVQREHSLSFLRDSLNGAKTAGVKKEFYLENGDIFSCYGCGTCVNSCGQGALSLKSQEGGFLYPVRDAAKCIHCGHCQEVCTSFKGYKGNDFVKKAYCIKNKEEKERMYAARSGIYFPLYQQVFKQGGVVADLAFSEEMKPFYLFAENTMDYEDVKLEQLHRLMLEKECRFNDSRYFAGTVKTAAKEIKERLESGQLVLFAGVACQIAGLKNYLGQKYKNLVTVENICHGAPSEEAFRKYLDSLEESYHAKVLSFEFKKKLSEETAVNVCVKFDSGEVLMEPVRNNSFVSDWQDMVLYRPSCYECQFCGEDAPRVSDLAIGKWGEAAGSGKEKKEIGTYVIRVNTKKGEKFLEACKEGYQMQETECEKTMSKKIKVSSLRNWKPSE